MWQHICLQIEGGDEAVRGEEAVQTLRLGALPHLHFLCQDMQDGGEVAHQVLDGQVLGQPSGVLHLLDKKEKTEKTEKKRGRKWPIVGSHLV